MRADWARYATVEEPISTTEAADLGSRTSAHTDSSSGEPDVTGKLADTAMEVLVPDAIIPPEIPTVTDSPEQVVPVTSFPATETQASTSATTLDFPVAEEGGGPTVITCLAQYIYPSRMKQGEQSQIPCRQRLKPLSEEGRENVKDA